MARFALDFIENIEYFSDNVYKEAYISHLQTLSGFENLKRTGTAIRVDRVINIVKRGMILPALEFCLNSNFNYNYPETKENAVSAIVKLRAMKFGDTFLTKHEPQPETTSNNPWGSFAYDINSEHNNTNNEWKIADYVRENLFPILKILPDNELRKLADHSYSKQTFAIAFPLLVLKGNDGNLYSPNGYIQNTNRYWTKPLQINGRDYFVCSQWWKSRKEQYKTLIDKYIEKWRNNEYSKR